MVEIRQLHRGLDDRVHLPIELKSFFIEISNNLENQYSKKGIGENFKVELYLKKKIRKT